MSLEKIFAERLTTPLVEQKPDDIYQEESFEAPTRDGRNSRHQVFAVLLEADDGKRYMFPYGGIIFGEGLLDSDAFSFFASVGEQLFLVTITGPEITKGIDFLATGKRESWHTRAEATRSIKVERVDRDK
jgi:hypothetical protein